MRELEKYRGKYNLSYLENFIDARTMSEKAYAYLVAGAAYDHCRAARELGFQPIPSSFYVMAERQRRFNEKDKFARAIPSSLPNGLLY